MAQGAEVYKKGHLTNFNFSIDAAGVRGQVQDTVRVKTDSASVGKDSVQVIKLISVGDQFPQCRVFTAQRWKGYVELGKRYSFNWGHYFWKFRGRLVDE